MAFTLISMALLPCSSAGADDIILLKVKNDLERAIEITVRSERPAQGAARSVVRRIGAGELEEIRLKSPDKFLAEIRYGGSVYKSRPMPLRAALTRNPNQTLSVSEVFMAAEGQPRAPQTMLGLSLYPDEGMQLPGEGSPPDEATPPEGADPAEETNPAEGNPPEEEVPSEEEDAALQEALNQQLAPSNSGRLRNRIQRGRALPRLRGR